MPCDTDPSQHLAQSGDGCTQLVAMRPTLILNLHARHGSEFGFIYKFSERVLGQGQS